MISIRFDTAKKAREYLSTNGYALDAKIGLYYRNGEKYGVQFSSTTNGHSIKSEHFL